MITYILESTLSLAVLFGLYWLLLRKEKTFVFNRFFLIFAVAFSLAVPFITIPVYAHQDKATPGFVTEIENGISKFGSVQNVTGQDMPSNSESVVDQVPDLTRPQSSHPDVSVILNIIYLSGLILFLFRFLNNIRIIFRKARSNEKIHAEGYRIVLIPDQGNPYCFLNTIFLNRNDFVDGNMDRVLLEHELEHIRQYHSADILFIELIRVFYWFNPLILLYRKSIKENHEYLADRGAVSNYDEIKNYSEKLLLWSFRNVPLVSGFNSSLTKKRLLMITKPDSGNFKPRIIKALSVLIISSLLILLGFKPVTREPVKMNFVPHEQYDTIKFLESGKIRDVVTYSDGFYMSNEITNREFREFTDWVRDNPDKSVWRPNNIEKEIINPITGKTRQIIFHIPERNDNPDLLGELVDSSAAGKLSKKYKNYFTDPKYDNYPVMGISAKMAEFYCNWKTMSEAITITETSDNGAAGGTIITKNNYRLPNENEWEYAAKQSGMKSVAKPRKKLVEGDGGELTHFIDNVSEWVVNPDERNVIARGGSWKTKGGISGRRISDRDSRDGYTGFRIVSVNKKRLER